MLSYMYIGSIGQSIIILRKDSTLFNDVYKIRILSLSLSLSLSLLHMKTWGFFICDAGAHTFQATPCRHKEAEGIPERPIPHQTEVLPRAGLL